MFFTGSKNNQNEIVESLSTLEKLAIGNYSNFLRTEPEGKPNNTKNPGIGRGQQLLNRLPGGQDQEEDLRQMRLHKFADSLMKQRQFQYQQQQHLKLQQKNVQQHRMGSPLTAKSPVKMPTDKNLFTSSKKSKSDTSQDSSPTRRKLRKKSTSPKKSKNRRSTSLTDLTSDLLLPINRGADFHSASDISPRSLATTTQTDPSSSSSNTAGTIVPNFDLFDDSEIDPRILEALTTNPSSLPIEFYGAFSRNLQQIPTKLQSQTSLNSRQSQETVITLEQLLQRHKKSISTSGQAKKSSSRNLEQAQSDSLDTDDEIQMIRDHNNSEEAVSAGERGRNDAEGQEQPPRLLRPLQPVNNWLRDDLR